MKYITLLLTMLLTLSGCGLMYDTDECPAVSSDTVALSFSMMSSGSLLYSRADDQHKEVSSEFRYFEDGIDIKDLAIFIFAKKASAGTDGEETLVYKHVDFTSSDNGHVNLVGSPGNYLVQVMILREELRKALDNYEISPSGKETIYFRMLMLANCSSLGTTALAKWNQITGQTYKEVIQQLDGWNFAMNYIYNDAAAKNGSNDLTELYKNHRDHVPMFGTALFGPVTEDALYYSRPENRIYLGEMNLLRALAKVRVVDNIPEKVNGYPKISSVEFISSQDMAHQLPYNAFDYENGQQVHTPSVAQDGVTKTTFRLGILPPEWPMTPTLENNQLPTGDVFIGFVPEQHIGIVNNDVEQPMPIFKITITNKKADGATESLEYNVPMTSYNGVNFNFGDNILRNHIYTLSVNNFGYTLDLTVDLAPYRSCVLEPFFGIERD